MQTERERERRKKQGLKALHPIFVSFEFLQFLEARVNDFVIIKR